MRRRKRGSLFVCGVLGMTAWGYRPDLYVFTAARYCDRCEADTNCEVTVDTGSDSEHWGCNTCDDNLEGTQLQ